MFKLKNHGNPNGTADTAPTRRCRKRRASGLTVFAVSAVLFSAVAMPAAQAHEPEPDVTCPVGYSLNGDKTECTKTTERRLDPSCPDGYELTTVLGKHRCKTDVEGTCSSPYTLTVISGRDWCRKTAGLDPSCPDGYKLTTVLGKHRCKTDVDGTCSSPYTLTVISGRDWCVSDGPAQQKPGCAAGYTLKRYVLVPPNELITCERTVGTPGCISGTLSNEKCVTTTTTLASYRCDSGTRGTGAFGIPVCRLIANEQCPAGTNYIYSVCYNPVTRAITDPTCPSGYTDKGAYCGRYVVATPYCTSGTLTSTRTHCTTTTTTPTTCTSGDKTGNRCVDTQPPTYTYSCADHSRPNPNNRCVSTTFPDCGLRPRTGQNKCEVTRTPDYDTCNTGTKTNNKCVSTYTAEIKSTCPADHDPQNGKCLHPVTPAKVTCPNGYQHGSGLNGGEPPYTAPSGSYWRSTAATSPVLPVHTCWQLHQASCPSGQTLGRALHGPTLSRLLVGYKTQAAPDGYRWKIESANPHYACLKLEEEGKDILEIIIGGVKYIAINGYTYAVKGGKVVIDNVEHAVDAAGKLIPNWSGVINSALDAVSTTVDATLHAYKVVNDALQVVLCAPLVGTTAAFAAGVFVSSISGNPLLGTVVGLGVSVAINDNCGNPTIFDQVELLIYLAVGADARAKVKAYEIYADEEKIGVTVCGPLEGLTLTTLLSDIVASLAKSPWYDIADWSISVSHEISCTAGGDDPLSVPVPASGLRLAAGDKRIRVSWSASATAAADGFGYRVQWKTAAQTWKQSEASSQFEDLEFGDADFATSYTVTGLSNGVAHSVRVAAFNGGGFSAWIDATATPEAPKVAAPGAASGLRLAAGDKRIRVSWSASATAAADGFGYRVQWKSGSQSWTESESASQFEDLEFGDADFATSYTITGLSNGAAHSVRVAAFNGGGFSAWIDATATPAKPKPASLVFESVSCAVSGSGWVISVSWSKSPETMKPDMWVNELNNFRGHSENRSAVAGTSTSFDVSKAGWYTLGMQFKPAGQKKVGDTEHVNCR